MLKKNNRDIFYYIFLGKGKNFYVFVGCCCCYIVLVD